MVTSWQGRRAAGMRRVVSLVAACAVWGIGIAAAAGGAGRTPAADTRPLAPVRLAGNTPSTVLRASAAGVLPLAAAFRLSGSGVSQFGGGQTAEVPEGELAPRRVAGTEFPTADVAASLPLVLLRPSGGVVTSRFGWRTHPIFGSAEFHTGIDIATRYGSPVVAARAGVVVFVGWESGYGRIVVLDHGGGLETMYSHLSSSRVGPSQEVEEGEEIGRIGSTGWSTGPHLFFEVRRNGVPLDPARYLK
ncbi:MAG TPA: M23 family metallopeptidase [bacterium]|nr:M23 family metallopeptidase [bacterium]